MMKRTLMVVFLMSLGGSLSAQQEKPVPAGWKNQIVGALNLTQVNFDNWTQGGENAFSWQVILDSKFVYEQKQYNWATTGKFSFGKTRLGDSNFRKSVDEIRLESVFAFKLGKYANPYLSATALTQFTAGFQYQDDTRTQVSNFLDPGYFTQSVGFGYAPAKEFKMRLGFALKETVTRNFPVPYTDDPNTPEIEKTRTEAGMKFAGDLSRKLSQNILFTARLESFSNLKGIDEIDVNWDNLFSARVSKLINVNFNFKLIYDKNVSKKRQIKQSLAIGLTYTFL